MHALSDKLGSLVREAPRTLVEVLPPPAGLRLRAWKNYPRMHGLFAPAQAFCRLIPTGSNAVDAGANRGVYAYWMATRANHVYAFEPLPGLSAYLRGANIRNITVFDVALSDSSSQGVLWVPAIDGEASLVNNVGSSEAEPVPVTLAPLDDFRLQDVGFLKIDVEGHELPMLRGADETIRRCRPVLFIEIEQRYHDDVPIAEIFHHISGTQSYKHGYSWRGGRLSPMSDFDLERDQLAHVGRFTAAYVNNFVFSDSPLT